MSELNEGIKSSEQKTLNEREIKRLIHGILRTLWEWLTSFLFAFSIYIIIFTTILMNARVPSSSMETTLMQGSRLIVNRLEYSFGKSVSYEDIIVFPAPDEPDILYVKRVVGLGGDTIEIKDGITYRNGEKIIEDYVNTQSGSFGPYVVPTGKVFVMGDNRDASWDARFWTNKFVDANDIIGKALFEYWPLNEIKILF